MLVLFYTFNISLHSDEAIKSKELKLNFILKYSMIGKIKYSILHIKNNVVIL